jgi:hypothetical protein
MSTTIIRLMTSETIIGDVVGKDAKQGTLFVENPVNLETVVSEGNRYVLMRDMLKDSTETVMPINAINIMYHYRAAPQVEAYYRGCLPEFERAKKTHLEMYDEMLKELVNQTLEESTFEIQEGQHLQPSSNTMN